MIIIMYMTRSRIYNLWKRKSVENKQIGISWPLTYLAEQASPETINKRAFVRVQKG